jgi:hypothetical protein
MSAALIILSVLLGLCPALVTFDGAVLASTIPLLVSAGLISVSIKLPDAGAKHLARVLPLSFAAFAAAPAVLITVQMLPLPFLINPVWSSVHPGLAQGSAGHISVDIGATAIALARYLTLAGAMVLAAAVATDRYRAGAVLSGVVTVIVLISLAVLWEDFGSHGFSLKRDDALDCACLGITLSAASGVRVFEHWETRHRKSKQSRRKHLFGALACLVAFLMCAGAIAAARSGSLIFAAASGFLTFSAAAVVRRFHLGGFGAAAFGVAAVTIAAALVSVAGTDRDPRFAFVKKDPALVELSQRMLDNAPLLGNGAGTFGALAPVYQSSGAGPTDAEAVTAAAQLSIEMGRTALWCAIIAATFGMYAFLRGAASRGRDSFYAAGAAACIVTLLNLAFVNTGLVGQALPLLSAIILGLGLAQAKSRSVF